MSRIVCSEEEDNELLLGTVIDNCNAVAEMALETIRSQHIPLICLRKEDCRKILVKYQMHSLSLVEEIVALIALTDYISCACANSEEDLIKSLEPFKKKWRTFFLKLSPSDMTADQLCIVIKVTKRCLERMSGKRYKAFLKNVLKMAEKSLNRLCKTKKTQKPNLKKQKPTNFQKKSLFVGVKETQQHPGDGSKEMLSAASIPNATEHKGGNSINNVKVKNPCHIKKSRKQSGIGTKNTLPATSVTKTAKNKRNKRNAKLKNSPDIVKDILKSCENTITEKNGEKAESNPQLKRQFNQISAGETTCHKGQNIQHSSTDDVDPPCKKPSLDDDFINGKVNAFKMLMKPRRTGKQLQNNKCTINV